MNMSKLSKLKKDLRSSAKLNKFQALKLKGGDDKRNRERGVGLKLGHDNNVADDILDNVSHCG